MKKENLQKSIVLMGPSCVGKSLLSGQLANELDFSVICVDDVFAMAQYDADGFLKSDKKVQKEFVKRCVAELKESTMSWTLRDEKHSKVLAKQIGNIIDTYNFYHNLLGGFDKVKECLPDYEKVNRMGVTEAICYYNVLTLKVVKMLLKEIDTPVILDVPGFFGWEVPLEAISPKVLERFENNHIDIGQVQEDISSILSLPTTVLLEPGQDYQKRNATNNSATNNFILKYFDNYYENAKIQVSTNALFNNPENRYFKQRRFIDAREAVTKEELMNKCEINNLCQQIMQMREELSMNDEESFDM